MNGWMILCTFPPNIPLQSFTPPTAQICGLKQCLWMKKEQRKKMMKDERRRRRWGQEGREGRRRGWPADDLVERRGKGHFGEKDLWGNWPIFPMDEAIWPDAKRKRRLQRSLNSLHIFEGFVWPRGLPLASEEEGGFGCFFPPLGDDVYPSNSNPK